MSEVVTKGEFARLRGVTPGRVSQWIADGKIGPEAMEGEGRFARIRVAVATAQLKARLDIGQRFGNGLSTDLTAPVPPEARGGEGGAGPAPFAAHGSSEAPPAQGALDGLLSGAAAVDLFDVQIRKEKLVEIQARKPPAGDGRCARGRAAGGPDGGPGRGHEGGRQGALGLRRRRARARGQDRRPLRRAAAGRAAPDADGLRRHAGRGGPRRSGNRPSRSRKRWRSTRSTS